MMRSCRESLSSTQPSGSPVRATSSSIGFTYAGAPPCSGPESAPTAADSAAPQPCPVAGTTRGLRLQVRRRTPRQSRRFVRLRVRHLGVEIVVDEKAPDVFVRVATDELLDVDAAVAERTAFAVRLGDLRLDGDDALEPRTEVVAAHVLPSSSISLPTDRSRAAF